MSDAKSNFFNKLFFVVFILSGCYQEAKASSVIALRTSNYVIIGADSKYSIVGNKDTGTMLKIHSLGSNAYCSGTGILFQESGSYDAIKTVKQAYSKTKKLKQTLVITSKLIVSDLKGVLSHLKNNNPNYFFNDLIRNKKSVSLLVAGIENNKSKTYALKLWPILSKEKKIELRFKLFGMNDRAEQDILAIGEHSYFDQIVKANPRFAKGRDPINVVRNLISGEIKANPSNVGGPINILYLSPNEKRFFRFE